MGTLSTPRLAPTALGSAEKCLEMGETQVLLFIGTFEKCLGMGDTQFLLFLGTFEKCLEMRETQFLLFKGTFETSPTACQESVIQKCYQQLAKKV